MKECVEAKVEVIPSSILGRFWKLLEFHAPSTSEFILFPYLAKQAIRRSGAKQILLCSREE